MLDAVGMPALIEATRRERAAVRPARWLRRRLGWLLLAGWIALPLLPAGGLVLTTLLGLKLF